MRKKRGWVKHFSDGQLEIGTDDLIEQGKASWRNGKLDGIVSVSLYENNFTYNLQTLIPSEWWQGDEYYARIVWDTPAEGTLVRRFIQFKIDDAHIGKYIVPIKMPSMYKVSLRDNRENALIQLLPEHKGMWLTLYVEPGKIFPGIQLRKNKG